MGPEYKLIFEGRASRSQQARSQLVDLQKSIHAATPKSPGLCEVFEHAPASFTCKVDAAALYVTCDRDFYFANPLARRHECLPVVLFYNSAAVANKQVPSYDPSFLRSDSKIRNRDANKRVWRTK
nr:zinc finger protein CONSTANS-LIKE 4-like [Ipomoea batatas]